MLSYVSQNPVLLERTGAELGNDIVSGAEKALFGPESRSITVEGYQDNRGDVLSEGGHFHFLGRIADLETSGTEDFPEPLGLAIGVRATQLSIEVAAGMDEEEIKNLEFEIGDGAFMTLSNQSSNLFNLFLDFIPMGSERSNEGAWFLGQDAFTETPQISRFEGFLAIADLLKNGRPNANKLHETGEEKLMEVKDATVVERCTPYFYGLYKRLAEIPNLADIIEASRQRDLKAMG